MIRAREERATEAKFHGRRVLIRPGESANGGISGSLGGRLQKRKKGRDNWYVGPNRKRSERERRQGRFEERRQREQREAADQTEEGDEQTIFEENEQEEEHETIESSTFTIFSSRDEELDAIMRPDLEIHDLEDEIPGYDDAYDVG